MRINYVRSESQDDNFHIFRLLLLVLTVFGLLPIAFLVCLSTEIIRTNSFRFVFLSLENYCYARLINNISLSSFHGDTMMMTVLCTVSSYHTDTRLLAKEQATQAKKQLRSEK